MNEKKDELNRNYAQKGKEKEQTREGMRRRAQSRKKRIDQNGQQPTEMKKKRMNTRHKNCCLQREMATQVRITITATAGWKRRTDGPRVRQGR
jgi:hypothetical protein